MKNILLLIIAIILTAVNAFAQNTAPVVTNVDFNMRNDGSKIVDITYDVFDAQGQTMTVTIAASSDGGATWNLPITQVTGAVGSGITNGTGKTIVWNAGAEIPNFYSATVQIRISADDEYVAAQPCPGIPSVTYGGKTYNTVRIGNQCWLKENLDIGTMIQGSQNATNNSVIEKYCYGNNPANCNTYGGLYDWNEAMGYVTTPGARGICPTGWHLPTVTELQTLVNWVEGNSNNLKSIGQGTGTGTGTNLSGFTALMGGSFSLYYREFSSLSTYAVFTSSTSVYVTYRYAMWMRSYDTTLGVDDGWQGNGTSIRCLKD